jgi:phenylpropionate dioxygenase-like ring-hydroxylating dioxygenase large terminal subunit
MAARSGYLQNIWYAAALASEVSDRPFRRTILDLPVVLYRGADGRARALFDRCPHRFVPLSRGRVVGDDIECGYHGLKFAGDGACVFNPHGDGVIPPGAVVRAFEVYERYGYVWVWPGEAPADTSKLPDMSFLEDPNFAVDHGYVNAKANYQLLVDNLLDLSHAPYLHEGFVIDGVSTEERLKATQTELVRNGDSLTNRRYRRNFPTNKPNQEIFGLPSGPMDNRTTMHWRPASILISDLGSCDVGQAEEDGLCLPVGHFITPETETTSHYFFALGRNRFQDDPKVAEAYFKLSADAFAEEDEPMVAAQQAELGDQTDILGLGPVYLQTDQASVAARRLLDRLIRAERDVANRKTPAA